MNRAAVVGFLGMALLVGILVAVLLTRGRPRGMPDREEPKKTVATDPKESLGGGPKPINKELQAANKKIADLEEENKSLKDRVKKLEKAVGTAKKHAGGGMVKARGAKAVSDFLNLDEARGDLLKKAFDEMLEKIRKAEAERANVEKDGETTTITVPADAATAQALEEEWRRQLGTLFSAEELGKFDEYKMNRNLFPWGFGDWGRTIKITPEQDGFMIRDEGEKGGMKMVTQTDGPESEGHLDGYRHLLEK